MQHAMHAAQFSSDEEDNLGLEVAEVIAADSRTAHATRPWVTLNMVTSIDGGTAVEGVSGALGGDGDHTMFHALRAMTDAIVVGAGTVRAEDYQLPRMDEETRATRIERGQLGDPLMAVVTASMNFGPKSRLFDPAERQPGDQMPLVVTSAQSPEPARHALKGRADLVMAGADSVDLAAALQILRSKGVTVALLEGGPGLNGQFVAEDLVDEVTMTLAPKMVAGLSSRMAQGPTVELPRDFTLDRVLRSGDELFLRYLRARSS